jgi:class 3 adenylate cyclase
VHIGECERRGDEWSGLTVHTGARSGAMAGPGEVLTSRTVRDLSAGSGLRFQDRQNAVLTAVSFRLVPIQYRSLPAVSFSGLDGVNIIDRLAP